jgi:hypothetical protein
MCAHQNNRQKAACKKPIMTNKGMLLLPRGFQGKNKLLILGCLGQIALNTGNSNWNTSGKEALFQFSLIV